MNKEEFLKNGISDGTIPSEVTIEHLEALLVVHYMLSLVEIGFLEFPSLTVSEDGTRITKSMIDSGWKLGPDTPVILDALGVHPKDNEVLTFMVTEFEKHGKDEMIRRVEVGKKQAEEELSVFDENDWNHFHDALLHATGLPLNDRDHLKMIYLKLPDELREQAKEHGMNDTVFRDNIVEFFKGMSV